MISWQSSKEVQRSMTELSPEGRKHITPSTVQTLLTMPSSISLFKYLRISRRLMVKWGGHWDFRFCGFGYFLDWFFGFCCKRLRFFGFGGHCGLRIFRFLASGFRFSWKILAVFRFWYPMWFLVFGRAVSFSNRLLFWVSVYYHIKP